jgi:hypothetical protein
VYRSILGLSYSGLTEGILCIGWSGGQSYIGLAKRTKLYRTSGEAVLCRAGQNRTGAEGSLMVILYRTGEKGSLVSVLNRTASIGSYGMVIL